MRFHIDIEPTIDERWIVLCNGFQWSDDKCEFDFWLGCGTKAWATRDEASSAVREAADPTDELIFT